MLYKCSATVSIHRQALLQESFSADSSWSSSTEGVKMLPSELVPSTVWVHIHITHTLFQKSAQAEQPEEESRSSHSASAWSQLCQWTLGTALAILAESFIPTSVIASKIICSLQGREENRDGSYQGSVQRGLQPTEPLASCCCNDTPNSGHRCGLSIFIIKYFSVFFSMVSYSNCWYHCKWLSSGYYKSDNKHTSQPYLFLSLD